MCDISSRLGGITILAIANDIHLPLSREGIKTGLFTGHSLTYIFGIDQFYS